MRACWSWRSPAGWRSSSPRWACRSTGSPSKTRAPVPAAPPPEVLRRVLESASRHGITILSPPGPTSTVVAHACATRVGVICGAATQSTGVEQPRNPPAREHSRLRPLRPSAPTRECVAAPGRGWHRPQRAQGAPPQGRRCRTLSAARGVTGAGDPAVSAVIGEAVRRVGGRPERWRQSSHRCWSERSAPSRVGVFGPRQPIEQGQGER